MSNSRFLISPWVRVPYLASKALSMAVRRLPGDWKERHGLEPVLVETFVDLGEVPGDLLPCGQLAVHWPDEGTQGECVGGRQDSEGRLPVSADERLEAGAADRFPSI